MSIGKTIAIVGIIAGLFWLAVGIMLKLGVLVFVFLALKGALSAMTG